MLINQKLFCCFGVSLSFFLLGCKPQDYSYDYLMQHPVEVQQILGNCDSNSDKNCETARRAEQDFTNLVRDRESDAQKFGLKILNAEEELVQKKLAYENAQQELKSHPEQVDLQKKIETLKEAYEAQRQIVNTLLAVVAAAGPPG